MRRVPAWSGTADSFLGGDHLTVNQIGFDQLPVLVTAPLAGTGFSVPLGPGTCSYLVQQTGTEHICYLIDFVVTPEPDRFLFLGVLSLVVADRRIR